MNKQETKHSLVVMTNGDVYYVMPSVAKALMSYRGLDTETPGFYLVVDQKSGATVAIKTEHISSLVNAEVQRG